MSYRYPPTLPLYGGHDSDRPLACIAGISNRVIARKLEREQKKVEGGAGGEKRKRLPANPMILENAP